MGEPLVEGRTGTDRNGRRVVVRNGRIVYADAPRQAQGQVAPPGSQQRAFNGALGKDDAEAVTNLRTMAGNARGRVVEAESLIGQLDQTPTGVGAGIGQALSTVPVARNLPFVPTGPQVARAKRLDALSSENVLRAAAPIKPVSNSDIQFLQGFQAGSRQGTDTNREFLRAQQWFDTKLAGQSAAMERWLQRYGSPSAKNERGDSFYSFWEREGARLFPRPVTNDGRSPSRQGYRAPSAQAPRAPVRVRTPQEAQRLPRGTVYQTPDGATYTR